MDLTQVRKFAGLPVQEGKDYTEEHVKKERALFKATHDDLIKVDAMVEQRLTAELTPEHKKQYTTLDKAVKEVLKVMKAHLDTYK